MEKKPYVRIDFKNLGLDYEYTICNWLDVPGYIELIHLDVYGLDQAGYDTWKEKGYLPEVTISIVMLTDEEFEKWFIENVEKRA